MRIIYLSKRFLNAFWAVPFVLIIRIIEPVLSIKILFLYSKRIGHFVCDSVLQAIKLEHLPKNVRHIIWFEEPSSNSQWSKMVLRNLPSNPLFENIDYWNRKIPGGEKHSQDSIVHSTSRDTEGLVGRSSFEFSFLEDEEAKALKWLQSFGWKKGEPGGTYIASEEDESTIVFEPYNLDNSWICFAETPRSWHGSRYQTHDTPRQSIQFTLS